MKHNTGFSKLFQYRQKIFIPKQFQMKFYKWTVSYLQYTKSNKLITLSVASLFLVKLIITISSVTQTEVEVTFFTIHSTSTYVTIWTYFFFTTLKQVSDAVILNIPYRHGSWVLSLFSCCLIKYLFWRSANSTLNCTYSSETRAYEYCTLQQILRKTFKRKRYFNHRKPDKL